MLDFTSVLYLGMHHGHAALRPWWQITTGHPAALGSTTRVAGLETALAALMGHESAALGSSTLHLFWDLFAELVREPAAIHVDAGTYPIARWGVERVAARGVTVTVFPMHDTAAVRARLAREPGRYRPIVVCDGLCPLTGRLAPLRDYAEACAAVDGVLVVDDTQGLGLLGRRPNRAVPYGEDGAGTPAWWGVDGAEIIVVNSLAKAFGVPLAVIAGRAAQIERFKTNSLTRIHCSPPSLAGISAAEHALALNAAEGAGRR
ncbi:MAG: aminotransferase class I/II-fold pyridoxal phosphate-dependent enzyme, partial [Microvirga sp.]